VAGGLWSEVVKDHEPSIQVLSIAQRSVEFSVGFGPDFYFTVFCMDGK